MANPTLPDTAPAAEENPPPPRLPPTTANPCSVRDLLHDPSEDAFSMPLTNLCDPRDPLSKYTDALMPWVQIQRPLSLFDHLNLDEVEKWWCLPGCKLLATPFDTEVSNPKLHNDIKGRILAAVAKITNSTTASVAAPQASEVTSKAGLTPMTFIIYNLSETHHQILLQHYVWSLVNISFQVAPLEPTNPDFLFTIKDFTTLENGGVTATVWEVWNDEVTHNSATCRRLICEIPHAVLPLPLWKPTWANWVEPDMACEWAHH